MFESGNPLGGEREKMPSEINLSPESAGRMEEGLEETSESLNDVIAEMLALVGKEVDGKTLDRIITESADNQQKAGEIQRCLFQWDSANTDDEKQRAARELLAVVKEYL